MSWPSTSTRPDDAVTIPHTMLISVVLPAPFGPSRAKISPSRMSRSMRFSASPPVAYFLVRPEMDTIARTGGFYRLSRRQFSTGVRETSAAVDLLARLKCDRENAPEDGFGAGHPAYLLAPRRLMLT